MTRRMNVLLGVLLVAGLLAMLGPRAAPVPLPSPIAGATRSLAAASGSLFDASTSRPGLTPGTKGQQSEPVLDVQVASLVPPQALSAAAWLELAFVVVGWLALTWLVFFVLWRVTWYENPFLAVRVAYTISVPFALAYLLLLFWPRYFSYVLPSNLSYVPYAVAGVIAILLLLIVWASHQSRVDDREKEPVEPYAPNPTGFDEYDDVGDDDTIDDDYLTDEDARL